MRKERKEKRRINNNNNTNCKNKYENGAMTRVMVIKIMIIVAVNVKVHNLETNIFTFNVKHTSNTTNLFVITRESHFKPFCTIIAGQFKYLNSQAENFERTI